MSRREFIAGLGSAAAWPLAARGQQRALPVVGYLGQQSADNLKNFALSFLQGLKETGYVDGQNVAIEYRWAEDQIARWCGPGRQLLYPADRTTRGARGSLCAARDLSIP